ncbi:hypothetical protein NQ317_011404 [Molorchus minor]|uniref:DDE Tnp4 domain-containing protein n=1 Tax=Molorchus minor TaxID=1323400 RepID=A0ABQ9IZ68_9CUCU|nr:hypothetical protein NQ317_011404 [Molorchus minor]
MPTKYELTKTQTDFYHIASFPRVIGYVDGTHVRIQSPGGDVQATCDSNLKRTKKRFENNKFLNCILLGNVCILKSRKWYFYGTNKQILGRVLEGRLSLFMWLISLDLHFNPGKDINIPYYKKLLTPLVNPDSKLTLQFHIRTRNVIEQCFGVWKRRFPVLAYGMRLKLDIVLQVIVATAVLHNIAKNMNEQEPPLPEDINQEELNYLIGNGNIEDVPNNENVNVNHFRNQLITDYFSRL